jgi:hypothetical protein
MRGIGQWVGRPDHSTSNCQHIQTSTVPFTSQRLTSVAFFLDPPTIPHCDSELVPFPLPSNSRHPGFRKVYAVHWQKAQNRLGLSWSV